MINKKPTLAQQTYEKVCALETMLKAHLESKPPAASMNKQPFLATAAPGEALAGVLLRGTMTSGGCRTFEIDKTAFLSV